MGFVWGACTAGFAGTAGDGTTTVFVGLRGCAWVAPEGVTTIGGGAGWAGCVSGAFIFSINAARAAACAGLSCARGKKKGDRANAGINLEI